MTNVGISINLKDMFSSPLRELDSKTKSVFRTLDVGATKVSGSFKSIFSGVGIDALKMKTTVSASVGGIGEDITKVTIRATALKEEIKKVDKELVYIERHKINLDEEFKSGKISAEQYKNSLKEIEQKRSAISQKKVKLSTDFEQATNHAQRLNTELTKIKSFSTPNITQNLMGFKTMAIAGGAIATHTVAKPIIQATMELENAQTELQNVLMDKSGKVSTGFVKIDKIAQELGKDLPGTTADFYKMATTMKALNVSEKSLIDGVLKSSAYLGVVLKGQGVDFNEAATATAKFKEAFSIEDNKMLPFIDLIQKTSHTGVKLIEMQYAFSKAGAALKGIGKKGYDVAKEMVAPIGILTGAGISGETVGTGIGNMMNNAILWRTEDKKVAKVKKEYGMEFNFVSKEGKFLGFEHVLKELEKVKKLKSDVAKEDILKNLFGGGESTMMMKILMDKGVQGLKDYQKNLDNQADINKRVANSLGTLTNQWEAFQGTLTNAMTLLGGHVTPLLKGLTSTLDGMVEGFTAFGKAYPQTAKWLGIVAVGGGVAIATLGILGGALALVLSGTKRLFTPFSTLTRALIYGRKPAGLMASALCNVGECAGASTKRVGILKGMISGIGAMSTAQLVGLGALSAALVSLGALYISVGNNRHQFISNSRVVGKSIGELQTQITDLSDRKKAMNAPWYTPTKAWSVLTDGAKSTAKEKNFDSLIAHNKKALDKTKGGVSNIYNNIKVDVHNPKNHNDVAKGVQKAFNKHYFGDL